jgi:hypothetical protein
MKKWLIVELGLRKKRMSLEHLVVAGSKEILKK